MEAVLAEASYEAKAALYNSLGLELTFDAGQKVVNVEAAPVYSGTCRRGNLTSEYTPVLRGVLDLNAVKSGSPTTPSPGESCSIG